MYTHSFLLRINMIQFISEVSDSEQTKRAVLNKQELLWMWFFIIVPICGRLADRYMGIVFFPFSKNDEVLVRNQAYEKHFWDNCIIISHKRACFADLLAEAFKNSIQWKMSLIRKCHMSFRCAACCSIRIPGRYGCLSSKLLSEVLPWISWYISLWNAGDPGV